MFNVYALALYQGIWYTKAYADSTRQRNFYRRALRGILQ